MTELEVEAVESVEGDSPEIDAPEYVLYGGKGGVGKTTMAAATALASARDGTETLVVSTDPAHSLSDVFETEVPAGPARIRADAPLWGVEIDPDRALAETPLFDDDGGFAPGGLGTLLGDDAAEPADGGMPGADEAAAMQQLIRFLDDPRFERVVVDTAPTGHTLRLLELPELLDSMVGQVLRVQKRLSGLLDGVPGFGDDEAEGADAPGLDEFRERIERLRAVLRDPARTDFRVVLVPEELSVRESERLVARLDEFGVPVGTVVVNRVLEDPADVTGAPDAGFASPDLDDCGFCQRRWAVQRGALAAAQDLFRSRDVRRVPLLAGEARGDDALGVVAAALAG
jgi:arsenite-transporting ATPase